MILLKTQNLLKKNQQHNMTKIIFVTGGVVSSLGKGIAASSLASVLKARGFSVHLRKFEPYLNVDPGTMSPFQHGEVYVTEDGAETDLDLGHYERFTGITTTRFDAVTTGQIYASVIARERRGDYLGATVQVIPHITDAIQEAMIHAIDQTTDFLIIEIGGTVGDIESLPFLEAIRQYSNKVGRGHTLFLHLILLPFIATAGEVKTKPAQHSVKTLLSLGIQTDILLCRTEHALTPVIRDKLALFCNIHSDNVIEALDVASVYELPVNYASAGLDKQILTYFNMDVPKANLAPWHDVVHRLKHTHDTVRVAIVGKYTGLKDAYKSLNEAIIHGGLAHTLAVDITWLDAEDLENNTIHDLKAFHGIIVPGGYGDRGTLGKQTAIHFARTHNIPFLGICYGMQLAVVEFAQNVLGLEANTTELGPTPHPVVGLLTEWVREGIVEKRDKTDDLGGTMRLGSYACHLIPHSKAAHIFGKTIIHERHRHRYEVNKNYIPQLEAKGLKISGYSPDGTLPEMIELDHHPWFMGTQGHPELKSRPFEPHPLFTSFIKACFDRKQHMETS